MYTFAELRSRRAFDGAILRSDKFWGVERRALDCHSERSEESSFEKILRSAQDNRGQVALRENRLCTLLQNCSYTGTFDGDIAVDVIGIAFGCRKLDSAIPISVRGMRAQIIAKGQMPLQFCGICGADIQVVLHQMGFASILESVSIHDTQIALVCVADLGKLHLYGLEDIVTGNYDVNVDDGLCRESFDRGAADVLYAQNVRAECIGKLSFDFGEFGCPIAVIGCYDDGFHVHTH